MLRTLTTKALRHKGHKERYWSSLCALHVFVVLLVSNSSVAVFQELENALYGYLDPGRPVIQLVAQLVYRLLQEEGIQQYPQLLPVRREEGCASRGFQVGAQEGGAHPQLPVTGPRLQDGKVFLAHHRPRGLAQEGELGGVLEGAQHPGHVPQGRPLQPPLAQRASRLPLEVDDHEVVTGGEQLPEVIVPVAADAHGRDLLVYQLLVVGQDLV